MGNSVSTMTVEEDDEVRGEGTLHSLARVGDVEGLKAFLQSHPTTDLNSVDANVNIQQHPSTHVELNVMQGYTPLHLSCDRGHLPTVEFLLTKDVDLSIKVLLIILSIFAFKRLRTIVQDPDEFTAIELARIAEHDDIVALLEGRSA